MLAYVCVQVRVCVFWFSSILANGIVKEYFQLILRWTLLSSSLSVLMRHEESAFKRFHLREAAGATPKWGHQTHLIRPWTTVIKRRGFPNSLWRDIFKLNFVHLLQCVSINTVNFLSYLSLSYFNSGRHRAVTLYPFAWRRTQLRPSLSTVAKMNK